MRSDVRLGDAAALAVLLRHLVQADAFLRGAVEIGFRDSRLPAGVERTAAEAVRASSGPDVERAARARASVGAALVVLGRA
jgi:hypothetical protein